MNLILLILVSLSFFMMTTSHPLSILIMILTQTFMICSYMWLMLKSSWFSFILFLIFLGGLMVLFVYVVSLASNEKFNNMKLETGMFMVILLTSVFLIMMMNFYFNSGESLNQSSLMFKMMMIFSKNNLMASTLIMIYLFFTLLVAVKISSKFEGPLRKIIK